MISQIERYKPGGVLEESFVCSLVDSVKKTQSVTNEKVHSLICSEMEKDAFGIDGSNVYTQSIKFSNTNLRAETQVNEVINKGKTGTVAEANDKNNAAGCNVINVSVRLLTNDVSCENEVMKGPLIKLTYEYRDVVSLEGVKIRSTKLVELKIRLKEPQKVVNIPPYRIPHKYRDKLERINYKMLKDEIIEPSTSPYNSPLICVLKNQVKYDP